MMASESKADPRVNSQSEERQRMDMKQILIFGLFLVPALTCKMNRCYDDHELSEAAERKLRSHYPQPPEPSAAAAPDAPVSCPVALYQQQPPQHISDRSLSPWRYVLVTKKDHFPSTYVEVQCLCSGCILIQKSHDYNSFQDMRLPVESHDYNSVPIKQSRVFLKRELCSDGKKYHLKPVTVEVAVGCTCVRVKTSS
ncbi:LOW QUALITY PROTEIN: interleukin-17C [Siniperca chuatsi]|uniref:LOW QUALITY PROTEIN: interleukin-17C n=1 Tax=Siniperca chuatsi TaxID=119488 RepID=UPI001CE0631E|nr:LOW QUALITY PROTEIN: interleukin-17C [Siniperca chuatsi]